MLDDEITNIDSFFISKEIENIFLKDDRSLEDTISANIIFNKEKQHLCKVKSYEKKNNRIKIKFFCVNDVIIESLMCSNIIAIEFFKQNKVFIKYDMCDSKVYNVKINKVKNDIYILEVKFRSE